MATRVDFQWQDPLLLEQALSDDERMVQDSINRYCQERSRVTAAPASATSATA
jgi:glutaryl-CoA dehydrogenase